MTEETRKHRTDISCAFMHDSMGIPVRIQFTDGNVTRYAYNFSIEREKRKLSCSSEREKNRPKVNGKEFDKMHGLNTYDYGARQYNPVTARWDRVDPLCEKYYAISPYAYCGDNPINAIDDKGDSTCVLNYGSGSHQHLAMLIQNDEGKWSYYSFNGTKIFSSTFGLLGGAPHNNLGERSFDSPTDFLNSTYNSDETKEDIKQDKINGYGYTEGYILPTTPKEDGIIKEKFVKAVNEGYNLLTNQCANGVQKALNSVGIKTTTINNFNHSTSSGAVFPMSPLDRVEVNPYLPSSAFKAIRDNNPEGIYKKVTLPCKK